MNDRAKIWSYIFCLAIGFSGSISANDPDQLDRMRNQFAAEEKALLKEWDSRATRPGVDQARLRAEMEGKLQSLRAHYTANDPRGQYLKDLNADLGKKGLGLKSTGGSSDLKPGHLNADGDFVITNKDGSNASAADQKRGIEHMQDTAKQRGLDPQSNAARTDVNKMEVTVWEPDSKAGRKIKAKDPDAFKTQGGLESTRNPGAIRDELGEYLDNRAKFEKARTTGDLKTMGKSLQKAGNSRGHTVTKTKETVGPDGQPSREFVTQKVKHDDGRVTTEIVRESVPAKQNKSLYDKAKNLQKYGTTHEAGVTTPGKGADVNAAETSKFVADMDAEMKGLEAKARAKSELREKVRQNFAESFDKAPVYDRPKPVAGSDGKTHSGVSMDPGERPKFNAETGDWTTGRGGDQIRQEIKDVRTSNEGIQKTIAEKTKSATSSETYSGGRKAEVGPDKPAFSDPDVKASVEAGGRQGLADFDAPKAPDAPKTGDLVGGTKPVAPDVPGGRPKPGPLTSGKSSFQGPSKLKQGLNGALEAGGKIMAASDILNTGQDIIDYKDGKKSAGEVLKNAAVNFTPVGQAWAVGEQLGDKAGGYLAAQPAVDEANRNLQQAHAVETALEARENGASADEARALLNALNNGDKDAANRIAQDLNSRGVEVDVSKGPETYSAEADDTVVDRTLQVATGIKDQVVRAGSFVVDAVKNTGEIIASSVDIASGAVGELGNSVFNDTQAQGLYDRLVDTGANPDAAAAAVSTWQTTGDATSIRNLRDSLNADAGASSPGGVTNTSDGPPGASGMTPPGGGPGGPILDGGKNPPSPGDGPGGPDGPAQTPPGGPGGNILDGGKSPVPGDGGTGSNPDGGNNGGSPDGPGWLTGGNGDNGGGASGGGPILDGDKNPPDGGQGTPPGGQGNGANGDAGIPDWRSGPSDTGSGPANPGNLADANNLLGQSNNGGAFQPGQASGTDGGLPVFPGPQIGGDIAGNESKDRSAHTQRQGDHQGRPSGSMDTGEVKDPTAALADTIQGVQDAVTGVRDTVRAADAVRDAIDDFGDKPNHGGGHTGSGNPGASAGNGNPSSTGAVANPGNGKPPSSAPPSGGKGPSAGTSMGGKPPSNGKPPTKNPGAGKPPSNGGGGSSGPGDNPPVAPPDDGSGFDASTAVSVSASASASGGYASGPQDKTIDGASAVGGKAVTGVRVTVTFNALTIPDRFQILYGGAIVADSGMRSNGGTVSATRTGSSDKVVVRVLSNSKTSTRWNWSAKAEFSAK